MIGQTRQKRPQRCWAASLGRADLLDNRLEAICSLSVLRHLRQGLAGSQIPSALEEQRHSPGPAAAGALFFAPRLQDIRPRLLVAGHHGEKPSRDLGANALAGIVGQIPEQASHLGQPKAPGAPGRPGDGAAHARIRVFGQIPHQRHDLGCAHGRSHIPANPPQGQRCDQSHPIGESRCGPTGLQRRISRPPIEERQDSFPVLWCMCGGCQRLHSSQAKGRIALHRPMLQHRHSLAHPGRSQPPDDASQNADSVLPRR